MSNGFVVFKERNTAINEKPNQDDLKQLAPDLGESCVPLEVPTFFSSDVFDDFLLPCYDSANFDEFDDHGNLSSPKHNSLHSSPNINQSDPLLSYLNNPLSSTEYPRSRALSDDIMSPASSKMTDSPPDLLPLSPEHSFNASDTEDSIDFPDTDHNHKYSEDYPLLSDDLMWGSHFHEVTNRALKSGETEKKSFQEEPSSSVPNTSLAQLLAANTKVTGNQPVSRTKWVENKGQGGGRSKPQVYSKQKNTVRNGVATKPVKCVDAKLLHQVTKPMAGRTLQTKFVSLPSNRCVPSTGIVQHTGGQNGVNLVKTPTVIMKTVSVQSPTVIQQNRLITAKRNTLTASELAHLKGKLSAASLVKRPIHDLPCSDPSKRAKCDVSSLNVMRSLLMEPTSLQMSSTDTEDTCTGVPAHPNSTTKASQSDSVLLNLLVSGVDSGAGYSCRGSGKDLVIQCPEQNRSVLPSKITSQLNVSQKRSQDTIHHPSMSLLNPDAAVPSLSYLNQQDYDVNAPIQATSGLLQGSELLHALELSESVVE